MQSNVNHNTHAVFNFNSNEVRTLEKDNQIWFVLSDVATALDFSHTPHATRMLDDDERSVHIVDTSSENGVEQKREVTIINESGLYSLILKSRKASAKVFKKWVTSEVLPAIRKTGSYTQSPYSSNPTDTLTLDQCDQLRDMMRTAADGMLSQDAGKFMVSGWSKLKAHFGVAYRQIPQYKFSDALAIISRHVADHAAKQLPPPAAPLFGQRILTRLEEGGRYTSQIISPTAHIIEMSDLDEILKRAGKMIVPIEAVRALQGLAI